MRRLAAVALGAVVLLLACGGIATATATASPAAVPVAEPRVPADRRVLVISLPAVEWADVQRTHTPNLDRLFARSAIGALVTNGVERPSPLGDSYLSLGAGARATAAAAGASGQGFGADEPFGRDPAGVVFTTRTGARAGHGLVYMPIADLIEKNDSELYGAKVGLLGDELARAGISRAVIANGDGSDPSTPETRVSPYRRAAVGALTTSVGRVPGGRVDRGLLRTDPTAPFGLRLDHGAAVDAFRAAWQPRSVVVVEGSDLVRADLAGKFASTEQADALRSRALRDTDRLVGKLLAEVDPARDTVMVVGPLAPNGEDSLTVASIRGPGFAPGLLRSTTTQRDGFVNITDVAPTILGAFGIDRPDDMEGRRMESAARDDSVATRVGRLVDVNEDGIFRDSLIGASMGVVVGVSCGLALLTVLVDRWRRARWLLVFVAIWLLGYLDATYLAGPFHFARNGGRVAYWLFVIGVAAVLALAFMLATRRRPIDAILVALGSVVALHLVDLVTGAHLEWNTVFGYSPTIGIRFVGEGNMTFAQLAAASVLLAGLLAWRVPTRRGLHAAFALLGVTVVVIAMPFWGNDFGGAVSVAPGFALLAWLLLGRRLRWQGVLGLAGVLVGSAIAVGLLDLLRASDERTHVGKFFEKVATDFPSASLILRRKAAENLAVLGHSLLLGCIVVTGLVLLYLWLVPPRSLRTLLDRITTARATALALGVVALLGFLLNDSGIAIPGMMAAVFLSTLVFLIARGLGWADFDWREDAVGADGNLGSTGDLEQARDAVPTEVPVS